MKKIITNINTFDEWFDDRADAAIIEICSDRIERIKKLAAACKELGVYKIAEFDYTPQIMANDYDHDGPLDEPGPLKEYEGRMECHMLNVTDSDFFWTGYYKHSDIRWETDTILLKELETLDELDMRS